MISVLGYGSLLSERSARETVPGLKNFRLVRVPGYRRIFNKVGVVFLSRHGADPEARQIASCATQAHPEAEIICSQFECSDAEFAQLYEREHRFQWVEVESVDAEGQRARGRICTESSDDYYRRQKCRNEAEYQQRVGQYYTGKLWRNDILPFPRYLAFCLQAAEGHGAAVLDNFLDQSFLADGCTSLRCYLTDHPELTNWRQIDCGYSYR
ncbi:gamma-glutamylcyclotransferase [Neptuniibacter halophilus]|uniref:gamma-glutamylcyclotransferase n=1 Tax=Neptuniibacter halophilus TaxID=651666 RepID=UPI0025730711|nr:gamma-glutamylcyclotransferase [Neptuniibacter halophilus]